MRIRAFAVVAAVLSCSVVSLGFGGGCSSESEPVVANEGAEAGVEGGTADGADVAPGSAAIRLLAINDFHGALAPEPAGVLPARGGAAWLAAHVKRLQTANSVFVSAGDLVGGSPLSSALFHDEATIEVMNAIGLRYAGVGNHEFDEGRLEGRRARVQGRVATMEALLPEIQARGAASVVLLLHQGGRQTSIDFNACEALSGPIVDLATRMPSAVKVILSAHTHGAYNCKIGDKVVTSAGSKGTLLTQVDLVVDLATQTISSAVATNVSVDDDAVTPDPTVAAIVARYDSLTSAKSDEVVGTLAADFPNAPGASGESLAGDLIADAMLEATAGAPASAQVAIMNTGGIRGPFTFAKSGAESIDGQVTYGEAFKVQPFSNTLVTVSITGTELLQALEAAVTKGTPHQVSGLTYAITASMPAGSRIAAADVTVGGAALVLGQTYRVTTNSIVADATSGSAAIANGKDPVGAGVDLDALVAYFRSHPAVAPPGTARITLK